MTVETPNSKLLSAIIILLIVLILVIISSILYEKYEKINNKNYNNNQKQPIEQIIETFANYQDVKTKTINWCKKMQAEGLLTPDQYDQCTATFKDVTAGVLPKEFKVPATGLAQNFSLYNTKTKDNNGQLSSSITGENANNVMLVTQSGLYLACKPDNTIYFIKNINDSTINQQEIYFTLVPQSGDVYAIMSPYKRYLIANTNPNNDNTIPTTNGVNVDYTGNDEYSIDKNGNIIPITTSANVVNINPVTTKYINTTAWTASFTGTDIGPMSLWTVSKVNDNVIFESIQYNGFFMSFNDTNNSLEIIYGNNDSAMWVMIPKEQTNVNNKYGAYTGAEYIVSGENVLQKFKNVYVKTMCLNIIIKGLTELQELIRSKYTDIANIIRGKVYENGLDDGRNNDDINTVLNKITNTKNSYIADINEVIRKYTTELKTLDEGLASYEYDQYLSDLSGELNGVQVRIENNNKIMARQQDNYDDINKDYDDINKKTKKAKQTDETAKINIDLVNNYTTQKSYLLKLYPFLIVILGIGLIYLSYLTFMKFKVNIYDKYI